MSRARDRLGRPLPAGSAPPDDVPAVPDLRAASDEEVWVTALQLIADGLPFHAHEVFEDRWRVAVRSDGTDADAWRALAQWGAALTHAARGNAVGARRLAERARAGLAEASHVPACLDADLVRSSCDVLATCGR